MNFKLPKNSLFAILLRSRWWISTAIGTAVGLVGVALLPESFRLVGALSGFPFLVIGALAARRQWRLPSPQQVDKCREEVAALAWPAFAARLEAAFAALRYGVEPVRGTAADFVLHRDGRRTLVSARRWKSARVPLLALLALPGSLTPSMANISRPMSPMRSQMSRISVNSGPISPSRVLTKAAKVV